MSDYSHRGFRVSIFIRRSSNDMLEVRTTICAPAGLIDELGDPVAIDVVRSSANSLEKLAFDAFERAKKAIDNIVSSRAAASMVKARS
jgi:hypothetical protein